MQKILNWVKILKVINTKLCENMLFWRFNNTCYRPRRQPPPPSPPRKKYYFLCLKRIHVQWQLKSVVLDLFIKLFLAESPLRHENEYFSLVCSNFMFVPKIYKIFYKWVAKTRNCEALYGKLLCAIYFIWYIMFL